MRVNLDMGKSAYGWMIMKDENIPGTVVRTSTIPEELGRLVYLLTDKTGRSQQHQCIVKFAWHWQQEFCEPIKWSHCILIQKQRVSLVFEYCDILALNGRNLKINHPKIDAVIKNSHLYFAGIGRDFQQICAVCLVGSMEALLVLSLSWCSAHKTNGFFLRMPGGASEW